MARDRKNRRKKLKSATAAREWVETSDMNLYHVLVDYISTDWSPVWKVRWERSQKYNKKQGKNYCLYIECPIKSQKHWEKCTGLLRRKRMSYPQYIANHKPEAKNEVKKCVTFAHDLTISLKEMQVLVTYV